MPPLTQGALLGVKRFNQYGAAADLFGLGGEGEGIADCMQYLVSDDDLPMYMKGYSIYLGYTITKQPDSPDYSVEVNDETGVTYQWYSVEKEETIVTSDPIIEFDPEMYKGNFDSSTNKWSAIDLEGAYGYLMADLAAGEQLVVEFDAPIADDVIMVGYFSYEWLESTQSGNTYTFIVPEDDMYALYVYSDAAAPMSVEDNSETPAMPDVMAKKVSYINETAVQGQNSAALNTAGLVSGYYFCEATWSEQGQSDRSVAVEYHSCVYTYTANGNVITENCDCGHEETATLNAPAGTLIYDGTEKKTTVTYSNGWLGGDLTISYEDNINAGTATATITKNYRTASVTFTIEKAEQAAPVLGKTDETFSKKADGMITGVTADMEYRKEGETVYQNINSSNLENLEAGTYYVRFVGNDNKTPSDDAQITIAPGRKLVVTYKADGTVVGTVEVDYGKDAAAPEIPAKEGYTETAPAWDHDGKNITADTEINAVYTKNQPGEFVDVTSTTNVGGAKFVEEIGKVKDRVSFT